MMVLVPASSSHAGQSLYFLWQLLNWNTFQKIQRQKKYRKHFMSPQTGKTSGITKFIMILQSIVATMWQVNNCFVFILSESKLSEVEGVITNSNNKNMHNNTENSCLYFTNLKSTGFIFKFTDESVCIPTTIFIVRSQLKFLLFIVL